jgi:hypothetical protein
MTPYRDPNDPTITYTMGYIHQDITGNLWPRVYAGLQQVNAPGSAAEPYSSIWPTSFYFSWDDVHVQTDRYTNPDTIFMRGDTTRIWTSMVNAPFGSPTTLPVGTNEKVQAAEVYEWNPSSQRWLPNVSLWGPSTFLDVKAAGQGGRGLDLKLGLNIRMLSQAPGKTAWLRYAPVHVVKIAVDVQLTRTAPFTARFAVQHAGGPPIPPDARFHWDFGDNSAAVTVTSPGDVTHTFPSHGPYPVTLHVLHAKTNQVRIARVVTNYQSSVTQITPRNGTFFRDSLTRFAVQHQRTHPINTRYRWTFTEGGITDTVRANADTTAAYTFRRVGTYAVMVQVTDSAGTIIGQDSTGAIVRGERWAFTSFTRGALTSTLPAGSPRPLSFWEDSLSVVDNTLRDSLLARPAGGTLQFYKGTRPQAWRPALVDDMYMFNVVPPPGADAIYMTFPRGAAMMASPVAATGNPLIEPGLYLPIYKQPVWANTLTRTPLVRYLGRAATRVWPVQSNLAATTPVTVYLELDATATPTGLSGTITFVVSPVCGGLSLQQCPAGGISISHGEVRRVFHFTAVPK